MADDNLAVAISELRRVQKDITDIKNSIRDLNDKIEKLDEKADSNFVSQKEFDPIRKVVYGMVSLIMTAVIGALLTLILKG